MNQIEDFVKIEPEYFLKGMYVDTDVFYIQENRPVLFCKQTVITDDIKFCLPNRTIQG